MRAFSTPPDEPLARLIEHQATDYLVPESAGDRFTRIEIVLFVGRSLEAKRELYRAVCEISSRSVCLRRT